MSKSYLGLTAPKGIYGGIMRSGHVLVLLVGTTCDPNRYQHQGESSCVVLSANSLGVEWNPNIPEIPDDVTYGILDYDFTLPSKGKPKTAFLNSE